MTRTNVAVRVQHHPSRRDLLPTLLQSLAPLPVVVSPHVSDPPSPWAGYQLALRSGLDDPSKPTHVLVLQDDVEVCRNLPRAVERIATAKNDGPVGLFLSRLPPRAANDALFAAKRKECYVRARTGEKFFPAVAVLWPVLIAESFLAWAQSGVRLPGYPNLIASDDAVIGEWIRRTQAVAWHTVPSLIEHPDRAASTIGRRAQWGKDKGRIAHIFIGTGDPLEYDW